MNKKYYVYRIKNKVSGEFYFGMRSCYTEPLNDLGVKYFTSGNIKSLFMRMPENFTRQILFVTNSRYECFGIEQKYIFIYIRNKLCSNRTVCKKIDFTKIKLPTFEFI